MPHPLQDDEDRDIVDNGDDMDEYNRAEEHELRMFEEEENAVLFSTGDPEVIYCDYCGAPLEHWLKPCGSCKALGIG